MPLLAFGYPNDNHTTRPPRRRPWDAVYSDASLNTQIDTAGTGDLAKGEGPASSSCSAPGVVWAFLEELRLEDHDPGAVLAARAARLRAAFKDVQKVRRKSMGAVSYFG